MADATHTREAWGTKIGLILAAAGNAIGIGNLLRFPGQAARNGGGAFIIPYLVCLLLFGIPMMWVAWAIGRHGGKFGHGSTPGMFDRIWRQPLAKYLGVLGVALPLVFCFYYTYIESWCLAYAWFSLNGTYTSTPDHHVHVERFLTEYLGDAPTASYFSSINTALLFMGITLVLNLFVLYRGVRRGIELLAKIALPLLLLFCVILSVRVITLPAGKGTFLEGLNFIWNPDFSRLSDPGVWISAAGQIFFTLSIGFGSLECYASYVRENDDIALTGLTTAATNEGVEIIFGSMIAIPAATVFLGLDAVKGFAGSTFGLGMVAMSEVLRAMPLSQFFGAMWFLLLFFAAFTSSVAVCQPVVAFFQDEARQPRGVAVLTVGLVWLLGTLPVAFWLRYGVLDEFDFWAGAIGLVVFALIEAILFAWIWGRAGWEEVLRGAIVRPPAIFWTILRFVTPILLLALFLYWGIDAIRQDKLTPKVKLGLFDVGVHERPGLLAHKPLEERKQALQQFEERLRQAVTEAGRDLYATIHVRFEVDEESQTVRPAVLNVEAPPEWKGIMQPESVARYLADRAQRYEERPPEGGVRPVTKEIELILQGLYTAPYIWIARLIMIGFLLAFGIMIHSIWSTRAT